MNNNDQTNNNMLIPKDKPIIVNKDKPYKEQKTLKERKEESEKVRTKYPDRIPIICEKAGIEKDLPSIDKNKYLVPADLTVSQFQMVVRSRLLVPETTSIFFFVGKDVTLLLPSEILSSVYERSKDEDGFLYISYSGQNVLG
ncbi:hypothetical protein ABK040_008391 [Willaertia magna]